MNDETHPTPTEPIAPLDQGLAASLGPIDPATSSGPGPAATVHGRTPRTTDAVRAGLIVGTGLVLAIGAAVALGASPSPSASTGNGRNPSVQGGGIGSDGPGFGPFGFGGPAGPGKGWGPGGPSHADGRGFGAVSVTTVNGSSVSLATKDGWTRTITVAGTTKITKGGAAATLADLGVGAEVRFSETRSADGTYTIDAIEIVVPQTAGIVTAVGADTVTITLRDGMSQTIRTTGATVYHLERADGKRTDVTVGSTILASGEKAADGSLTAASVWVRLPHVMGTVTSVGADSITLTRRDGTTVTIHVGSSTTIRVAGIGSAKLSDVKTGMGVVVEGAQRTDGSIDATAIGAGGPGMGRGHDGLKGAKPDASAAPDASSGTEG